MFPNINAAYNAAKRDDAENEFILESVLDVEETLPGSDEELDDIVDSDSVPEDVYAKLDKELDRIVMDPNYDDTEAEEMLDDDFDVDDISDAELDAIVDEAVIYGERLERVANAVANLSEKAGNNMANNSGMGLLKTLSESVQQFHNGKMEEPIGKAYEPVETPDASIDETKLENDALRENAAVATALERFHSLMEAANPDVEDFPGKEGTTQADGDTPAGMPEPNGDEDGNNVGGDDQVVDQEAKDVGVEDGGSDAIDVIKANESVNRYRAIAESAKGEEKAMRVGGALTGGLTGAVAGAVGGAKASKAVNAAKAELEKAEASGDADAIANARQKLRNVKVSSAKRGAAKYGAVGAAAGYGLGHASAKLDKMVDESVTNPDVEDFPNQTGAGNDHGEKEGALPEGQEPADFPNSTGDKKVNSGDVPTNRYKTVAEAAVTTSVGNAMADKAVDSRATAIKAARRAQQAADTANNASVTDKISGKAAFAKMANNALADKAIDSMATSAKAARRARQAFSESVANPDAEAVAETSIRPPEMPEFPVCPKCGCKHNPDLAKCPKDVVRTSSVVEAAMVHLMEASNPNVEDFPKAEGTHSAEGNGVPAGMSHEDDSVQPAYTDQSDFEQNEVGVEDGGTDAINVIKANESVSRYKAIIEAAKAKAAGKEVCPKCGKDPCECEC